jgi:hypothetical protein
LQESTTEKLRLLGVTDKYSILIGTNMTTIVETVTDESGTTTHTYVSELPEMVPISEWIRLNKSPEQLAIWEQVSEQEHTNDSLTVYKNWLETYKVIHTVTQSDGTILVHNYKTYKFN